MTKPKPDKIIDLPVLLAFSDSSTGEAAIAELTRRLRDSESAIATYKERYDDAALKGDDALVQHLQEAEAFERVSARISVALSHARKRLVDVQQAERQQAGENARAAALLLVQEGGELLHGLLAQSKDIAAKLARWSAVEDEVSRLNDIARAGGAEVVAMPSLPDDAEAAADKGADVAASLEKFLRDESRAAYARKQRAIRKAEAEARKRAEAPTEEEAATLRAKGFDPDILASEPSTPDEHCRRLLVQQEMRGIRGQGRGAPAPTNRI